MYNLWHKLDEKKYQRDDDPLKSAELLLDELELDKLLRYPTKRIPLQTCLDGFQCLAWALPSRLVQ